METSGFIRHEQDSSSFQWTITNFGLLTKETHASPVFRDKQRNEWQLNIAPTDEQSGAIGITLTLVNAGAHQASLKIRRKFGILRSDEDVAWMEEPLQPVQNIRETEAVSLDEFFRRQELLDAHLDIFQTGKIKVRCEIELFDIQDGGQPEPMVGFTTLPEEFDITIVTRTDKIMAHKVALSARSQVFRSMLMTPMLESKEGVIHITDFPHDVVQAMITFIYTGRVDDEMLCDSDVLTIANKYDLENLKDMCQDALVAELTLDNSMDLLMLADCASAKYLKIHAMNFINAHKQELRVNPEFSRKLFSNTSLLMDLYLSQ